MLPSYFGFLLRRMRLCLDRRADSTSLVAVHMSHAGLVVLCGGGDDVGDGYAGASRVRSMTGSVTGSQREARLTDDRLGVIIGVACLVGQFQGGQAAARQGCDHLPEPVRRGRRWL